MERAQEWEIPTGYTAVRIEDYCDSEEIAVETLLGYIRNTQGAFHFRNAASVKKVNAVIYLLVPKADARPSRSLVPPRQENVPR
jgi:hypothetical protein